MEQLIRLEGTPRTAQWGSDPDGYRAWPVDHIIERVVEYPWALKFLKYITGNKVLDIGPGPFYVFPQILQYMNYNVTAIDVRPSAKRIIQDDICNSVLPINNFDAIFCISTMPHFYDKTAAIQNIKKLIKKNGLVVITTGFSINENAKISNGYITTKDGTNERGCSPLFKKEIDEWCKIFSETIEIIYWKAWEKGWYLGERLSFPIECNEQEAQLIGVAFKNG